MEKKRLLSVRIMRVSMPLHCFYAILDQDQSELVFLRLVLQQELLPEPDIMALWSCQEIYGNKQYPLGRLCPAVLPELMGTVRSQPVAMPIMAGRRLHPIQIQPGL